MPLTEISHRLFKNPRQWRDVKNLYGDRLRKLRHKWWEFRIDGLEPDVQAAFNKP